MAHHGGEHEWDLTDSQVKEAYYVRGQYSRPFPIPCAHPGSYAEEVYRRTKASGASRD